MRIGYIRQGRTDLQRAVRELVKGTSRLCVRRWQLLKRVGRYLLTVPRAVQLFLYQRSVTTLTVYCDTDHAGCARTLKSTMGVVLMLGSAMLRSMCL